ncbi:hypothetical protein BCR35DRAFT_336486 [Leucosporidium creatinivorum]|uniref:DUF7918 domain-containing protein n=1 Tax=Leucosporidium creatinivorum TaxID=106004 RepID=A0A1Y2C0S8_9BASI|nr:hypothetical protein BCR35DRAFT_336486 [Leucosporidium creatinivorum]
MAPNTSTTALTSPLVPGFSVWVEVNGVKAPIYSLEQEGSTTSGFIEAVEGAQFSVHTRDERKRPPSDSYRVQLIIDGMSITGSTTNVKTSDLFRAQAESYKRQTFFSTVQDGQISRRPFQFSALQVTDDDNIACSEEEVIISMSSIRLLYRRVKVTGTYEKSGKASALAPSAILHEKSKKGLLSHQMSFGAAQPCSPRPRRRTAIDYESIDTRDKPLAAFEFKYRSKTLLELEGHIPTTEPAAPAVEEKDDPAAELERLRARVADLEKVVGESKDGKKVAVKQEVKEEESAEGEDEGEGTKGKKRAPVVIVIDD